MEEEMKAQVERVLAVHSGLSEAGRGAVYDELLDAITAMVDSLLDECIARAQPGASMSDNPEVDGLAKRFRALVADDAAHVDTSAAVGMFCAEVAGNRMVREPMARQAATLVEVQKSLEEGK